MNKLCTVLMLLFSLSGFSQTPIPSYSLSVTFQKTTNIIFPYRIEKADIGSGDVIGHKDGILPNVLFLKAGRKQFIPTNLSVYTSDGKFYSFIVRYSEEPDTLNILFDSTHKFKVGLSDFVNEERQDSDAAEIKNQPSFLHGKVSGEKMKVVLQGIYIRDHLLWFKVEVSNHSQIDYSPEYIRFFVKEKHSAKRTAIQEQDVELVWDKSVKMIPGKDNTLFIFAFAPFTLSRQKVLILEISEKNGGRTITLTIPSKSLLKSRLIR
jgi:conjugative transposon TraN protein